jgi:hypothetical protein
MAAVPVSVPSNSNLRRRPIALTRRRIEANRRNATRSSGPRTLEGKAKVARNAVKHGFFATQQRWTPRQQRDFEETLAGLRDDLKPQGIGEESCVWMLASSYARMAALWRYENIAALKYHQRQDREMDERIASAKPVEAARLRAGRENLRRAGLWRPTIPGPREARAIIRYGGSLDRTIRRASLELEGLKSMRAGGFSSSAEVQKQTHFPASPSGGPKASRRDSARRSDDPAPSRSDPKTAERPETSPSAPAKTRKQSHYESPAQTSENAKTNPLSSMFTGNRHERRRAKALAARRR